MFTLIIKCCYLFCNLWIWYIHCSISKKIFFNHSYWLNTLASFTSDGSFSVALSKDIYSFCILLISLEVWPIRTASVGALPLASSWVPPMGDSSRSKGWAEWELILGSFSVRSESLKQNPDVLCFAFSLCYHQLSIGSGNCFLPSLIKPRSDNVSPPFIIMRVVLNFFFIYLYLHIYQLNCSFINICSKNSVWVICFLFGSWLM